MLSSVTARLQPAYSLVRRRRPRWTVSYLSKSAFLYPTLHKNNWFHLGAQEYREKKEHIVLLVLEGLLAAKVSPHSQVDVRDVFRSIHHVNLLLILQDLFNYEGSSLSKIINYKSYLIFRGVMQADSWHSLWFN